jgi:large subunit ribosomal protein L23
VIKDPHKIIIRPVITEKSTRLKDSDRVICFEVARDANKIEIKKAIEHLFKTKDWKKAYVKLREGEKMIEYFEAV